MITACCAFYSLLGCASAKDWVRPGATPEQMVTERNECYKQAMEESGPTPGWRGMQQAAADNLTQAILFGPYFNSCLEKKGYGPRSPK
jgi:hypothetical protein